MRHLALILVICLGLLKGTVVWCAGGFDFEFKQMGLHEAIESIAKMQKKNVIFSRNVENKKIDLKLEKVSPESALNVLLKSQGLMSIANGNILHVITVAERAPASRSTNTFLLRHVLAKEVEVNVKTFLGDGGSVSVNEQMNALIINANSDAMGKIREIISDLDQENRQVFIDAKVVEASNNFTRQIGIEWGTPIADRPPLTGANLQAKLSDDPLIAGTIFKLSDSSQLQARIRMGERDGDLKVLTNPRITTLNGKAAVIENTQTFNVRTLAPVQSGAQNTGAILAGGLQSVTAGIRLKVTPFIMSEALVRLDIDISKSDPDFSNAIDSIPGITESSANTSLIVKNSQTVSIGGLNSNSKSYTTFGAPFLSRIPIIGLLFGSLDQKQKDSEVMIFLTPSVFRSGDKSPDKGNGNGNGNDSGKTSAPAAPTAPPAEG